MLLNMLRTLLWCATATGRVYLPARIYAYGAASPMARSAYSAVLLCSIRTFEQLTQSYYVRQYNGRHNTTRQPHKRKVQYSYIRLVAGQLLERRRRGQNSNSNNICQQQRADDIPYDQRAAFPYFTHIAEIPDQRRSKSTQNIEVPALECH